jgi:N-acetylneuraminic acid mutarotase
MSTKPAGILLAVLFLAGSAPAQELLTNPGFETWPLVSWQSTPGMASTQESGTVHNGVYSCDLTWINTGVCYLYQDVGVLVGEIYEFSFWAYDNDIWGKARVCVEWLDLVSNIIGGYYGSYSDDLVVWQQLTTGEQTAPPGAVFARVEIRLYDVSGWPGSATVYVDDASLQQRFQENTWTQMFPAASPLPRKDHAMASLGGNYELLFGGRDRLEDELNDTWVYDLSTNTWTEMTPATSPPEQSMHAVAWLGDDKALLYPRERFDTWVYDLSENTWTEMNPTGRPDSRSEHAMAWIDGDQVLLFGGHSLMGDKLDDTWLYDLSENTWTEKFPTSAPEGGYSSMAWIGGDRAVLFGGGHHAGPANDDTWVYDLSENAWTQMCPAISPSPRILHAMEWLKDDQVLLFGGYIDTVSSDETWIYDLSENVWTQITPPASPLLRHDHDMAWLGGGKTLLFGGWCWSDSTYGDTWIFAGADVVDSCPPLPPAWLTATRSAGDLLLQWAAVTQDTCSGVETMVYYVIYRGTDPDSPGGCIAFLPGDQTQYLDPGAVGDTLTHYYYAVVAADTSGNTSDPSEVAGEFDRRLANGE